MTGRVTSQMTSRNSDVPRSLTTRPHIDLLDLDRWEAHGPPHEWFRELRAEAPVWRHPSPGGGPGFWVVSRYDDVVALNKSTGTMSSRDEHGGMFGLGHGDELQERYDAMAPLLQGLRAAVGQDFVNLVNLDPPEHTPYRKAVSRPFTRRAVDTLEDRVRQRVAGLLDRLPDGPFDFVREVATPLTTHVMWDLIGAPDEDRDQLMGWLGALTAGSAPALEGLAAMAQEYQYYLELQHRGEDLRDARGAGFTPLVTTLVRQRQLAPAQVCIFLASSAAAGHVTTSAGACHGVVTMAHFPEQWRRVEEDPSLLPGAVEEVLRWSSPVSYVRRNALAPTAIGDAAIEPGDIVSLWFTSANRDEEHFTDPDRFDVGRSPNPHVALGGGGPHYCLGAHLGRLEIRTLLEEMLVRYQAIELVGPARYVRNNSAGFATLPLRLVPRRRRT